MYISNKLTKTLATRELRKGKYLKHSELDLFLHDQISDPVKDKWPLIKMPKTYEQELRMKNNARILAAMYAEDDIKLHQMYKNSLKK